MSDIETAYGVHLLVNSNMARALRAVSTERGSRSSTLYAGRFRRRRTDPRGRSGRIPRDRADHRAAVPGRFQRIRAAVRRPRAPLRFRRTSGRSNELDFEVANGILDRLRDEGRKLLRAEGFDDSQQQIMTQLDMKYVGQTSELTLAMPQARFQRPNAGGDRRQLRRRAREDVRLPGGTIRSSWSTSGSWPGVSPRSPACRTGWHP